LDDIAAEGLMAAVRYASTVAAVIRASAHYSTGIHKQAMDASFTLAVRATAACVEVVILLLARYGFGHG